MNRMRARWLDVHVSAEDTGLNIASVQGSVLQKQRLLHSTGAAMDKMAAWMIAACIPLACAAAFGVLFMLQNVECCKMARAPLREVEPELRERERELNEADDGGCARGPDASMARGGSPPRDCERGVDDAGVRCRAPRGARTEPVRGHQDVVLHAHDNGAGGHPAVLLNLQGAARWPAAVRCAPMVAEPAPRGGGSADEAAALIVETLRLSRLGKDVFMPGAAPRARGGLAPGAAPRINQLLVDRQPFRAVASASGTRMRGGLAPVAARSSAPSTARSDGARAAVYGVPPGTQARGDGAGDAHDAQGAAAQNARRARECGAPDVFYAWLLRVLTCLLGFLSSVALFMLILASM